MENKIQFNAQIRDDKLFVIHRKDFDSFVKSCGWNQCVLTLERKKKTRSNNQNSYLFGIVYAYVQQGIFDSWGERLTLEETHEFCKMKFCKRDIVNTDTGEVTTIPGSTRQLTTTEFMAYIQDIQQFAQEYLNTFIPDPGEQAEMEF